MSGLDVAAGAAGLISLSFMVFKGCIEGFVLLSTAQNFGRDADLVRCMIEWEQHRLFEWAENVRLSSTPNQNLNWQVIKSLLDQLKALLTDLKKLEDDYELRLVETDEIITAEHIAQTKKGLRGKLSHLKPKFLNETAQQLQKSSSPWRRLRWAAIDKEGIRLLLRDVAYLNGCLFEMLEAADRAFFGHALEALLRNIVSQTSNSIELDNIKMLLNPEKLRNPGSIDSAVAAAASLKQVQLVLGFNDDASSNISMSPKSTSSATTLRPNNPPSHGRVSPIQWSKSSSFKLDPKLLSDFSTPSPSTRRGLAVYNSQTVLLEWKSLQKVDESRLKYRIEAVACLLGSISDPSFHSLPCMGFLKVASGQYAYVFLPPAQSLLTEANSQAAVNRKLGFRTMLQLLNSRGKMPSLNSRFSVATSLAETLLQLHTSGWLHKGIRSENIILFGTTDRDWYKHNDLHPVFLAGYEYARADTPLDITEAPSMQRETEIYRHPALAGGARPPYKKEFDLYSLGCVLLEIGLWCSLQTILLQAFRRKQKGEGDTSRISSMRGEQLNFEGQAEVVALSEHKKELLTDTGYNSIMEELEFAAGKRYADVVKLCLTSGKFYERVEKEAFDEYEESEENESVVMLELDGRIVENLKACRL